MQPETNREIEIARRETLKLAGRAGQLVIRKEADLKEATTMLANIKLVAKNVKAKKAAILGPLSDAVKEIRSQFKPAEDALMAAESSVKGAMLKYHGQLEKRAEKKAADIEDKVDSGDLSMADATDKLADIKQAPASVHSDGGGAQFRTMRKIRITDAGKLPARYLTRERVLEALRLEVAEDVLRGGQECPEGAEVYEVKTVAGT